MRGWKLTYPANDRFSLYGALGGAHANASANIGGPAPISGQSSGYRVGIGMEHWFARPWGLRAAYHRQNAGATR